MMMPARPGDPVPKAVDDLELDQSNYRFTAGQEGSTQSDLLRLLDRDFDLSTIGRSLVDNGYFPQEPLVAIPAAEDGKWVVVEGNRRLAALKLLLHPTLRKQAQDPAEWDALAARVTTGRGITEVPVVIYQTRAEVLTFLGHRHISGIRKWEPLPKARFVVSLLDRSGEGATFEQVAREIGSRANTVRDNCIAFRLLVQARDSFGIETDYVEERFSVFYRALQQNGIAEYIGLDRSTVQPSQIEIIDKSHQEALRDIIEFVHGTRKVPPVLTDSRLLSRLSTVLGSPAATRALKLTRNLDMAWRTAGGETRALVGYLSDAEFYIREALRTADLHKDEDDVKERVGKLAAAIRQLLTLFPEAKA
jgi:hypothetical protein